MNHLRSAEFAAHILTGPIPDDFSGLTTLPDNPFPPALREVAEDYLVSFFIMARDDIENSGQAEDAEDFGETVAVAATSPPECGGTNDPPRIEIDPEPPMLPPQYPVIARPGLHIPAFLPSYPIPLDQVCPELPLTTPCDAGGVNDPARSGKPGFRHGGVDSNPKRESPGDQDGPENDAGGTSPVPARLPPRPPTQGPQAIALARPVPVPVPHPIDRSYSRVYLGDVMNSLDGTSLEDIPVLTHGDCGF